MLFSRGFSSEECWYIHENTTTESQDPELDFQTQHELMEQYKKTHTCGMPCRDF